MTTAAELDRQLPGTPGTPFAPGLLPLVAVFVALSALDLFLTWQLIDGSECSAVEANPIASTVLEYAGWAGLAAYKGCCVAAVLGAGCLLGRLRPQLGQRVVAGGCLVIGVVVAYSAFLLFGPGMHLDSREEMRLAVVRAAAIRRAQEGHEVFRKKEDELARRLAHRRLSLGQATEEMARFLAGTEYDPVPLLRYLYGEEDRRICLSASLVRCVRLWLMDGLSVAEDPLPRLEAEFVALHGVAVPPFTRDTNDGQSTDSEPVEPTFGVL
jgi:hypothetical protein